MMALRYSSSMLNPPGIKTEVIPTIALDHLCEVTFKDVAVPAKMYWAK